jgi:hypothetical protein
VIIRGDDRFQIPPRPAFVSEILEAGGLVDWARHRLDQQQTTT